MCALWSWHVGAIAGAAGCCCRIFLRSSRRRSLARGEWLQRKELTKHKFWSCKCTKVQKWEVWGMIRVWFGHDSGYDSETHLFWIQEALLLESLFPTVNLLRLLLNGCNGSTCQTTLDRTWIWRMWRFKCTTMIYIRRPAGVSSGCSSHVPLVQLRLGLCSSSTDFWFGCQPASQPAAHRVIPLISLISNTASSQARSQPAATSQPYTSSSNWASHLASQPATQSQPA